MLLLIDMRDVVFRSELNRDTELLFTVKSGKEGFFDFRVMKRDIISRHRVIRKSSGKIPGQCSSIRERDSSLMPL